MAGVSACKARTVDLELNGQTALITGASRGIGLAIASRFLEAGANVMLSSRTAEDLAEAAVSLEAEGLAGPDFEGDVVQSPDMGISDFGLRIAD